MRTALATVTAAAAVAGLGAAAAPAETGRAAATQTINRHGVGQVRLGATFAELHSAGLIGPKQPGCELAAGTRVAKLKAPLEGFVSFTVGKKRPRRVTDITVTDGAAARGVAPGDPRRKVRKAFPKAKFSTFVGIRIAQVPRNGGGRLMFVFENGHVASIGVPIVPFCE
jgi:hypothetical protein